MLTSATEGDNFIMPATRISYNRWPIVYPNEHTDDYEVDRYYMDPGWRPSRDDCFMRNNFRGESKPKKEYRWILVTVQPCFYYLSQR